MIKLLTTALTLLFITPLALAEPNLAALKGIIGEREPTSIAETLVPGIYEVTFDAQIFYLSEDGRFAIQGEIIDLEQRQNLTENRRNKLRADVINAVGDDRMVVFGDDEDQHTVTIFTDIDCGYCRKLHREIEDYNRRGIRVRYLMFPRAGIGSESYSKAVTVWCSEDQQDAMTRAKLGESLPPKQCENPVQNHYALGNQVGVRGTPAIVLESGEMLPGYIPAANLARILSGAAN